MNPVKYLLLVVIVVVLISSGSCIKCYNCVSTTNKDCLSPTENSALKPQECVPELIKNLSNEVNKFAQNFGAAIGIDIDKHTKDINEILVCQKIETKVNNEQVIIRGCQLKDSSTAELDYCKGVEKQTSGTILHCSLCHEDGCNAANWMTPVSTIALLIPAIALLF